MICAPGRDGPAALSPNPTTAQFPQVGSVLLLQAFFFVLPRLPQVLSLSYSRRRMVFEASPQVWLILSLGTPTLAPFQLLAELCALAGNC